MGLDKLEIKGI